MMRLIDADAFLKHEIERCDGEMPYVGTCSTTNFTLKSELEKMGVIDAVPISVIESWLTEIAFNNWNNYLSDACEELISRLGGLKRYYEEKFCTEQTPRVDSGIEWHKVAKREMTEDKYDIIDDTDLIRGDVFLNAMPDDKQEILVVLPWGTECDICVKTSYGYGLVYESGWQDVIAWAAVPKYEEV